METLITKVVEWIKAHWILALVGLFAVVLVFFPKLLRIGSRRKRPRRRIAVPVKHRRTFPRSVGIHRSNGSAKKPWQIKGSLAAKRHMSQIRKYK